MVYLITILPRDCKYLFSFSLCMPHWIFVAGYDRTWTAYLWLCILFLTREVKWMYITVKYLAAFTLFHVYCFGCACNFLFGLSSHLCLQSLTLFKWIPAWANYTGKFIDIHVKLFTRWLLCSLVHTFVGSWSFITLWIVL